MSVVYNIGYEATDIRRFVDTLRSVGIECLVDVRAVPHSRKKGFSKNSLAIALEAAGIRYLHLVHLGDPKEGRDAARAGDYESFRRIYSEHLQRDASQIALGELWQLAQQQVCCMLCFERDPKTCHRSIVAERLVARGLESFELYGDDPGRYERHRAKLPRGGAGQGAAAPEH